MTIKPRLPDREPLWAAESFEDSQALRADFDRCSEGVYFTDTQGRIIFWSRGAERITGFLQQEVLGRQCSEHDLLVHCDDSGTILCQTACPLRATASDGKCREIRVHLRHRDGYRVPVRLRSILLKDNLGRTAGAAEVFAVPAAACPAAHPRRVFPVALLRVEDADGIRRRYGFDGAAHIFRCVERSLRRELDETSALARLDHASFVAVMGDLDSHDPKGTIERIRRVVGHTDTLWWGDAVDVDLEAAFTWVFTDDRPEEIIGKLEMRLQNAHPALVSIA